MDKKKLVDNLIANACCWEETDRETLNGLDEKKLKAMVENAEKEKQREANLKAAKAGFHSDTIGVVFNEKTGEWEQEEKKKPEPVANKKPEPKEKPKPKTAKEWLAEAPSEVQSVVRNAMASEAREKEHLVGQLTANVEDECKEAVVNQLKTEPLEKLRTLMALAPQPKEEEPAQNIYFGAPASASVKNSDIDQDDILPLPVMEFEKQAV